MHKHLVTLRSRILRLTAFAVAALAGSAHALPFLDLFQSPGCVEEVGSETRSASGDWWVSSGGRVCMANGVAATVQGALPLTDRWRVAYAAANPLDTDGGAHPQNIFRWVTRGRWQNLRQSAWFRIQALNMSLSPNRNASNGLLFFQRYVDQDNLYYAGIRVDGTAVVKKKIRGTYYTMAQRRIYGGTYHRDGNPNLLPAGRWIGMRTETVDLPDGGVQLTLEVHDPALGPDWTPVLSAVDGGQFGGGAIRSPGSGGIRTDFMDVEVREFSAGEAGGTNPDRVRIATGPVTNRGPEVRAFEVDPQTGEPSLYARFDAYESTFRGGVAVAGLGGPLRVATVPGPGGTPDVRIWDLATPGAVTRVASFYAYDSRFRGGVKLASGDVDGDGSPDVVTGTGPGGGPQVSVFDVSTPSSPRMLATFFAFDPRFTGGVSVAAGDFDGEAGDEIVVGAGAGGGPHVRVFKLDPSRPGGVREIAGFFAYDPRFSGGVFVAAGDVDGDGLDEIVTGAGPGGGPDVSVFRRDPRSGAVSRSSFFPYDPRFTGGVRVSTTDVDEDGRLEIVAVPGTGGGPNVATYRQNGTRFEAVNSFFAYEASFTGGLWGAGIR